jgi:hypothetical protein
MGRSVSVPRGAVCITYRDISELGYERVDPETGEEIENPEFDEFLAQIDFECLTEEMVESVKSQWKSFESVENQWLGDECKVLAENGLAYFGISTYCDLMSIWIVPKDYDERTESLANHWCDQIKEKFNQMFGDLVRIGGFSDGTSVYERKQA